MTNVPNFVKQLLLSKQKTNPTYSLRAFARDWGISPGRASEIISGKRNLTQKVKILLEKNFRLTPEQIKVLNDLMNTQNGLRLAAPIRKHISSGDFMSVCSWRYYAILSLLESNPNLTDHEKIAQALGLTSAQVNEIIATLVRLELLEIHENCYIPTSIHTTTDQDKINPAIQNFHHELTLKHLETIKTHSVNNRDVQAFIFNMNPQLLPKAKKIILRCMTQIEKECSAQSEDSEVFALSVFLSPISQRTLS